LEKSGCAVGLEPVIAGSGVECIDNDVSDGFPLRTECDEEVLGGLRQFGEGDFWESDEVEVLIERLRHGWIKTAKFFSVNRKKLS
jgi:hypothetical protein